MVYQVIGIMSGSSLDGLDIAFVKLEENRGVWHYEFQAFACVAYQNEMAEQLKNASKLTVPDFLKLNTRFGHYIGEQVNLFIEQNKLQHQVHFITSHGHTVFHSPLHNTSTQIGDGATIAAVTELPTITDLRSMDVALGGQGAPIVPIGDKLLFPEYDYWLNIGGIANITARVNDSFVAFDVCPANQVLNLLAQNTGKDMDENGALAADGNLLIDVLSQLNEQDYYRQLPPKSLSNEAAIALAFPHLLESAHDVKDLLHTTVVHIAEQIAQATKHFPSNSVNPKMLVTGGGAFNTYLVKQITNLLSLQNIEVVVPDAQTVNYKEALVMALIGTLRWREEPNVLKEITGASRCSISGALWMN